MSFATHERRWLARSSLLNALSAALAAADLSLIHIYTDDELRKLLSGHLCRCTGYQNIFRAVKKTMLRRLGKDAAAELVK